MTDQTSPESETITFPRWWVQKCHDQLKDMSQLPSGPLGDWAFLFRDILSDALAKPGHAQTAQALADKIHEACPHNLGHDYEEGPIGCRVVAAGFECVCEHVHMHAIKASGITTGLAQWPKEPTREQVIQAFETIRLKLIDCLEEPERSAFWLAVQMRDALSNTSTDRTCEICNGEGTVAYIQSAGGFSEPAPCYKCKGSGRDTPDSSPDRGGK